ncbi:MAG: DNA-directed RNA polymerase subunit alpha C-terminal domain-containing protein [Anaerolineae bacterium]
MGGIHGEILPEYAGSEGDGAEPSGRQDVLYEKLIEELDLSVRVFNSLKRTGITTIGDVLDMLDRGPDAMLAIRNFGEKSLDELVTKLKEKGYLPPDVEIPPPRSGYGEREMRHRVHGKRLAGIPVSVRHCNWRWRRRCFSTSASRPRTPRRFSCGNLSKG